VYGHEDTAADIDTAGGQSGSATYRIINGGRYGVAVHAYEAPPQTPVRGL
jgi:hypothetical protein